MKEHIEIQFQEGMTWENQGTKWHVDHRIPLAAFKTEKGVEICSWYRNMQPMWGKDNLSKGGRYKEGEDKVASYQRVYCCFPTRKNRRRMEPLILINASSASQQARSARRVLLMGWYLKGLSIQSI